MNGTNVENLNSDRSEVVTNKLSDNEQFNFIIQLLVDGYLKRKKQKSMAELLKEEGLEDRPGLIYGYHLEFIQLLIQEELGVFKVDLPTAVKESGEEFQVGKLSDLEKKYLTNKVNNTIGLLGVVRERELRKQQK